MPEERNKGNIRDLMRYCFEEMRENQLLFSYLYPFSMAYYRKFGYECCYNSRNVRIPLKSFSCFKGKGYARLYLPEESPEEIIAVYSKFIRDKNLAAVRSEKQWKDLLGKDPNKTRQYTYIWYDNAGQPVSYIIIRAEQNEKQYLNDMNVRELAWTDYDSLAGILSFLNRFVPQYVNFKCQVPEFLKMQLIMPEPYDIKSDVGASGMNRIVDLQRVFELMAYPEGRGRLAIHAEDRFLEWNNGTYLITWEPGGVEVVKKDCSADLSASIEVLTQLITGYTGIEDYMGHEGLAVHGNRALLTSVFKSRQLYMNDFF